MMRHRVGFKKYLWPLLLGGALLPAVALAQGTINVTSPLANVLPSGGTVVDLVFRVTGLFLGIIALFTFAFIIFSGFKLVIARDNEEASKTAKTSLFNSIYGFVAAMLAFTIIAGVSNLLNGTGNNELANANNLNPPTTFSSPDLVGVIITIIRDFLGLAFLVTTLMVVYGAYRLVMSGGNEEQVTAGKTILKWAVLGMVIILLAFTIVSGINAVLTGGGV